MIHACAQCGKRWKCAGSAYGCEEREEHVSHSPLCVDCYRTAIAAHGQHLVRVECRVCTARRHVQCAVTDEDPENLPCPNCGAEAMDTVDAAA